MAEDGRDSPASSPPPGASASTGRTRRLPAFFRYVVAALFGGAVASLTSYLLRSVGY